MSGEKIATIFDQMKSDVLAEYPPLPKWRVWFCHAWNDREISVTVKNDRGSFTQSYVTRMHKGKEHFVRFGRLAW